MWEVLTDDERRRLIRELLAEIKVGCLRDGVQNLEIVFSFLPQLMDNTDDSSNGDSCGEMATNKQGLRAETSMTRAG